MRRLQEGCKGPQRAVKECLKKGLKSPVQEAARDAKTDGTPGGRCTGDWVCSGEERGVVGGGDGYREWLG